MQNSVYYLDVSAGYPRISNYPQNLRYASGVTRRHDTSLILIESSTFTGVRTRRLRSDATCFVPPNHEHLQHVMSTCNPFIDRKYGRPLTTSFKARTLPFHYYMCSPPLVFPTLYSTCPHRQDRVSVLYFTSICSYFPYRFEGRQRNTLSLHFLLHLHYHNTAASLQSHFTSSSPPLFQHLEVMTGEQRGYISSTSPKHHAPLISCYRQPLISALNLFMELFSEDTTT